MCEFDIYIYKQEKRSVSQTDNLRRSTQNFNFIIIIKNFEVEK